MNLKDNILDVLKKANTPLTANELSHYTNYLTDTVISVCRELVKEDKIILIKLSKETNGGKQLTNFYKFKYDKH